MQDGYRKLSVAVKVARVCRGLTQRDLAEMTGINTTTINFIENKKVKPRATTVVKLARAFDIDPEEWLKFIN